MSHLPKPFLRFPSLFSGNDLIEDLPFSIYEDREKVYVEVHAPGMNIEDIRVEFHDRYLIIHAENQEEEKEDKKYYRKAKKTFAYELYVPGNIDAHQDPHAELDRGILTVSFTKVEENQKSRCIKVHAK